MLNWKNLFKRCSFHKILPHQLHGIMDVLAEHAVVLNVTDRAAVWYAGLDWKDINNFKTFVNSKFLYPHTEMVGIVYLPIKVNAFRGWGTIERPTYDQILVSENSDNRDQVATIWNILTRNRFSGALNLMSRDYIGGGVYKKSELPPHDPSSVAVMDFLGYVQTYKEYFDGVKQLSQKQH